MHRRITAALAFILAGPAAADDLRTGWQFGVTQSGQGVISSGIPVFDIAPTTPGNEQFVQSLGGLVFTTVVNANVSLDLIQRRWDHGMVAGVALTQLVPTLQPGDGSVASSQTGLVLNLAYLTRRSMPRWSFELAGNYSFGFNGQLTVDQNGGNATGGQSTLQGQQVGRYLVNAQTHNFGARTELRLNRLLWDAIAAMRYDLAVNGVFTLVNGATPNNGSPLGAFVPATVHSFSPNLELRRRIGLYNTLVTSASARWQLPVEAEIDTGAQQNLVPETIGLDGSVALERRFISEDRGFIRASGTLGYRVPTEIFGTARVIGAPLIDPATGQPYTLQLDSLIYRGEVGLDGRFRKLDMGYRVAAGAAQARLFQPALGAAQAGFAVYEEPVVGDVQPTFSLTLDRRIEPVDISLIVGRNLIIGGLGSSAVLSDSASLAASASIRVAPETQLRINGGVAASRNVSAAGDALPPVPDNPRAPAGANLASLATNSASLAMTIGVDAPLYRNEGVSFDGTAGYTFTYTDPTIDLQPGSPIPRGLAIVDAHSVLIAIRGSWGRGPLDDASTRSENDRLTAYTTNPRDGQPLISARLMNLRGDGDPSRGAAPGLPSAAAIKANQTKSKKEQRKRNDRVGGEPTASEASMVKKAGPPVEAQPTIAPPPPPPPAPRSLPMFDPATPPPVDPGTTRTSTDTNPLGDPDGS